MNRHSQSSLTARILVPISIFVFFGCKDSSPTIRKTGGGTVTVEILRRDTTDTFQVDHVASGTTVETVMRSVDQVPVTIHGSGVTAFVDTIGELSTGTSEGWTFKVDGKFANEGIGSTTLTPPTTITWSYGDASELAHE